MNIKTTIILLVLLIGVGLTVFFTKDKDNTDVKPKVHTLVDVKAGDITRFVISSSDGKTIEAVKTNDSGGVTGWKLTQPVAATADTFKINSLLDTLTGLKSTAEVSASGSDAPQTGLDKPQFTVDLYQGARDTKLTVGNSLTVSGGVYVKVGDRDTVDVVDNSVVDSLGKPASDLRKTQLFETASPSVQQFTITRKDGTEIALEKSGGDWKMIKPEKMPADQSTVEDLISSVINMTPVAFVDQPELEMGLRKPTDTVTFSTTPPTTQTTTAPSAMPGGVTVLFGGYDDLEKKNVFAEIPDGTIVKVAASVLDSLNKKPFELRDKTVLDFDPAKVTRLVIAMNQPATTQPTTQPAMAKVTELNRRVKNLQVGPILPSTKPTSAPVVQTDWTVNAPKPVDADDSKVTSLLGQFHPLKADKYLEKPYTGKVVKKFTTSFTVTGEVAPAVLTLIDPGNDAALVGSYNGLTFEMPRTIATDLSAEFKK